MLTNPELEELKRIRNKYFNKMEELLVEMDYRQDYNSMVITYDSLERDIKELERTLSFELKYNEFNKAKLYLESPFDMMLETQGAINIKNLEGKKEY